MGGENATQLSHIYYSECADAESELNLYVGGGAILEDFVWDERSNIEKSIIYDGQWIESDTTVVVNLYSQNKIDFLIQKREGSNRFGPYHGLTLVNQHSDPDFNDCNYTYLDYEQI